MVHEVCDTASVSKCGKTAPSTRANGNTTRRTERAFFGTRMATFTKENFSTTNRMATESSIALMAPCTRASGSMTSSMDRVKLTGPTAHPISATIRRDDVTALVPISGPMGTVIRESGPITP